MCLICQENFKEWLVHNCTCGHNHSQHEQLLGNCMRCGCVKFRRVQEEIQKELKRNPALMQPGGAGGCDGGEPSGHEGIFP